jgi:hypothetical protein
MTSASFDRAIMKALTKISEMKFLQIVVVATVLVASVHAIKCNVGSATGTCPSADAPNADTCFKCNQKGVVESGSCKKGSTCDIIKGVCASPFVYSDCQTDNCNGCSPASAVQISVFLLIAALASMIF